MTEAGGHLLLLGVEAGEQLGRFSDHGTPL
jgi:hypothetical protein